MFKRRQKLSFARRVRYFISPQRGFKRSFHYLRWRLRRLPGTPEGIARGFAIGVGINFWPVLFTHIPLGYVIAKLLRGNVIAMIAGTMLGNPWTFATVYPLMYKLGKAVQGTHSIHHPRVFDSIDKIWDMLVQIQSWNDMEIVFHQLLLPMGIGGFLLGLPCVLAAYYLVRNSVRVYRLQRRKILLRKFYTDEHDIEDRHK